MMEKTKKDFWGYIGRFSLIHVLTYVVIGLIFMNIMGYKEQFSSSVVYSNFRSLDSPIVRAAALIQILRGAFLALVLFPFYEVIIYSKRGWLKLFGVLWGLTLIGAVAATPGSIEGLIYTKTPLIEHLLGLPEVTVQMLVFSWLFFTWERRVKANRSKEDIHKSL